MGICDLCERQEQQPDDLFCHECREAVIDTSEVVTDPVELVLNDHWPFAPLSTVDSTLCRCGEKFDGGPGYHRRHLAEKAYEALGLESPRPHRPLRAVLDEQLGLEQPHPPSGV